MDAMTTASRPVFPPLPNAVPASTSLDDPAQEFVTRLRSAAARFAAAAGAQTAVVREAVPPARHRRSRCRVVLRFRDGGESDVTFLGTVSRPALGSMPPFEASIQLLLAAGETRDPRWLIADDEAADGVAVDVTAWLKG
jgi:hypothetical protein